MLKASKKIRKLVKLEGAIKDEVQVIAVHHVRIKVSGRITFGHIKNYVRIDVFQPFLLDLKFQEKIFHKM